MHSTDSIANVIPVVVDLVVQRSVDEVFRHSALISIRLVKELCHNCIKPTPFSAATASDKKAASDKLLSFV